MREKSRKPAEWAGHLVEISKEPQKTKKTKELVRRRSDPGIGQRATGYGVRPVRLCRRHWEKGINGREERAAAVREMCYAGTLGEMDLNGFKIKKIKSS